MSSAEGSEPLLSLCIPVFRGEATVRRCIESAFGGGVEDIEVIVVDDASDDMTCEVVDAIDDRRLHLHRNDRNIGRAQNINRAMELARGRIVCVLPADCTIEPNGFVERLELLQSDPTVDVAFGGMRREFPDGRPAKVFLPFESPWCEHGAAAVAHLLPSDPIYTVAALIRRSAVVRHAGLRIDIAPSHRDWDFFLRVGATGRIAYLPSVVAVEYDHAANFTSIAERMGRMGRFEFQVLDAFTRWAEAEAPDVVDAVIAGRRTWARSALAHSLLARAGQSPRDAHGELGLALLADPTVTRSVRFAVSLIALLSPRWVVRLAGPLLARRRRA